MSYLCHVSFTNFAYLTASEMSFPKVRSYVSEKYQKQEHIALGGLLIIAAHTSNGSGRAISDLVQTEIGSRRREEDQVCSAPENPRMISLSLSPL